MPSVSELVPIVERSIEQAIACLRNSPKKFDNEQQFQELLYYLLANELQKSGMLFGNTKNGKSLILLIREKITREKYRRSNAKRDTYGRLDIGILNPENLNFPKDGKGGSKIPLSIGIEIKLNKTDSGWRREMDYLYHKLKKEVSCSKGRYIIFLSTWKKFEFIRDYRKWLSEHSDLEVRSNKEELKSEM